MRFVVERQASVFEHGVHCLADAGDDHGLAAFSHPDRGLMGALESVDVSRGVVVRGDGDVILVGLRHPAGHGWLCEYVSMRWMKDIPNGGPTLGIMPPEPLGVSPPFPMRLKLRQRA